MENVDGLMALKEAKHTNLRAFLGAAVEAAHPGLISDDWTTVRYEEDENPDALTDAWLDKGTSYIWKVGTLVLSDANKLDWARVFIGHEREPGQFELIGSLYFSDGENDDPGRCLRRYVQCAEQANAVFSAD